MSLRPNEKTLELNVISNVLVELRKMGYPQPFAYGLTLTFEATSGLDSSIELTPYASMMAFQFKKVHRNDGNCYRFRFNNNSNKNQHNLIHNTSSAARNSIWYALPAFENTFELARNSPTFIDKTFVIDPIEVGLINDRRSHEFVIDTVNQTYEIHSEKPFKKGKLLTLKQLLAKFKDNQVGVSVEQFRKQLRKYDNFDHRLKDNAGSSFIKATPKAIIVPKPILGTAVRNM